MKRREFVAAAVSVASAGVVGASQADEFASAPSSRPDRLDDAGASASDATEDAATATAGELAEQSTLEVVSTASSETPVRFRLVRADGTVAHDDVREMSYGERAYLSGLCERGETYVFTLSVEGATLVRETVEPGERAVFELLDETTVSVIA
ncbi:hypothetical protein [Halorubellus salinus]|uniref:hypothetical protein n=1 Tax=Halorubellus salinus TaxID=755309 RepID=UPI001D084321|nr:hypothetical protein [Halorubellus salinus]